MTASAEIKACCTAAYASPAASWLLGSRFHPGGAALTERLIRCLAVGRGETVVDVACGLGESSLQLAQATGARVIGIDLSADSVSEARRRAERAGLEDKVEFLVADAEALPLADGAVAGVLCECSLCTFPDKERATAEIARILKPGGRLALSDIVADADRLPAALRTLEAWVACLADARPLGGIIDLLRAAGLGLEVVERHDGALERLLEQVDARLRLARAAGLGAEGDSGLIERGLDLSASAREAVGRGILGYVVVVARRPHGSAAATTGGGAASNLL